MSDNTGNLHTVHVTDEDIVSNAVKYALGQRFHGLECAPDEAVIHVTSILNIEKLAPSRWAELIDETRRRLYKREPFMVYDTGSGDIAFHGSMDKAKEDFENAKDALPAGETAYIFRIVKEYTEGEDEE
ncbi:hypothetical protein 055SW001_10 [Bacillus phage 055SW001]|nr:hypothetical protein 022DV001_10 [Bacillus phage 022DV001]QFG05762.1 hypothetical protein 055SW001_10 [Bacillus phage 055SW001]